MTQVGYIANTLIFIIAGAIIFNVFSLTFGGSSVDIPIYALDIRNWGLLLALYVALTAIRFISILMLYPILRLLGYGFDLKVELHLNILIKNRF